ncbi:hypothetical protein T310_2045 [Rasamsonia emersonii CBS 393.64]|uniref:Uncharacterized protein n=1 Tax=Rasamsonia emersonii (strain ATCC 16479 / CBS 393.64 / IMI 116815) TaxID=1408163 RepID=A0A0F4Z255_RASE3|nr:hypothetical protein T310_2045 [Rasamsonia emersonii CBS 393.64]KKA23953.1 hypothetical protein T310_2045 [Rasamsonia emersonii CBS 393.64]
MAASLAPECNNLKEYFDTSLHIVHIMWSDFSFRKYDTCFLKWYSESMSSISYLFKEYKKCLNKALEERGIDKMLEEARKDKRKRKEKRRKTIPELKWSSLPRWTARIDDIEIFIRMDGKSAIVSEIVDSHGSRAVLQALVPARFDVLADRLCMEFRYE